MTSELGRDLIFDDDAWRGGCLCIAAAMATSDVVELVCRKGSCGGLEPEAPGELGVAGMMIYLCGRIEG